MAKDPLAPRNLKSAQCCPTVMLETDSLPGARPWPHVYNAPARFMLHLALLGGGSHLPSSCREGGQHCLGEHRVQILLQAVDPRERKGLFLFFFTSMLPHPPHKQEVHSQVQRHSWEREPRAAAAWTPPLASLSGTQRRVNTWPFARGHGWGRELELCECRRPWIA